MFREATPRTAAIIFAALLFMRRVTRCYAMMLISRCRADTLRYAMLLADDADAILSMPMRFFARAMMLPPCFLILRATPLASDYCHTLLRC